MAGLTFRNIQHMTNPCGVHAEAAKRGFFPGTLVISRTDCLWAHSEVERDAMEEMGTYPNASNDKRFLARHANLRGANGSEGNGATHTYCAAADLPYVKKLQELILARLERVGPRECEHASCSRAPYWGSAEDRQKRWCQDHSGDDSVCLVDHKKLNYRKNCEDCGETRPSFGTGDKPRMRWCGTCAKKHGGAVYKLQDKMCEDCGKTRPSFGIKDKRAKRWCSACSKNHDGAESKVKMCEDCGGVQPSFGLKDQRGMQWCGTCAEKHDGARRKKGQHGNRKCEDCAKVQPSYGMEGVPGSRWCAGCAHKHHPGAVGKSNKSRRRKQCEDCAKVQASFGMEGEPGRWWCATCARKHHPGAVDKTTESRAIKQKGSKRKRQ
jgi:hypothetical protein